MKLRVSLVTLATTLALASSADAAILVVNGSGELTGATGVLVGSTLYDVEFVDGTCAALFNGCDAVSDFDFTTEANAIAASQALLDQVFVDGGAGNFDSQPELTLGCNSPFTCDAWTPWSLFFSGGGFFEAAMARNSFFDTTLGASELDSTDFGGDSQETFARWTPSVLVDPVPEPASLTVLAFGLAGLGVRRWRQRKA